MVTSTTGIGTTLHFDRGIMNKAEWRVQVIEASRYESSVYIPVGGIIELVLLMARVGLHAINSQDSHDNREGRASPRVKF